MLENCHNPAARLQMKLADGTEIPFSCTADTLADDLCRRYKASDAPRFDFADLNQLSCAPVRMKTCDKPH
jgi:hypothetical protein